MTNYVTIITPIKASQTEQCRQYLRDNAEPQSEMRCRPDFRFNRIPGLHFASYIILDGTHDFEPSLVFEATFDGSKADFISDLLRAAGDGIHGLYQHCVGYPASGRIAPELAKEYLIDHDAGAQIYFSGNPGRTVAEIKDESGLHSKIVNYFAGQQPRGAFAPRLDGLLAQLLGFITGNADSRWADRPAPVPWEVRFRHASAVAVVIAALALACLIGAACDWVAVAYGHQPLLDSLKSAFEEVDRITRRWAIQLAPNFPVRLPLELFLPIGLAVIWLALRAIELVFTSSSKRPRDQFFITRVPLHIAVILRYGVLAFLIGAVLLALIPDMGTLPLATGLSTWLGHLILFFLLVFLAVVLVCLQYLATSLKIEVEVKKLQGRKENRRRLRLDLVRFAMVMVIACGALIISRYLHPFMAKESANELIYQLLLIAAHGLIGVVILYALGVLLLLVAHGRELVDKRQFDDPVALVARSAENAKKYAREEGGNNRFQNHLASLTLVKPGFVHGIALRGTLFLINLLSRFWFNIGTLGDIPTILSARWILIDSGRRLLFLDNYGGAWNSYLNEFIDMAAVKGLNAIWTNTFVEGQAGARCSFPETRFYFWIGAQAEQPFKAYVRESQIETIVWYGAYHTLSVVNINTSTAIRQSLSKPLASSEVDAIVQNL
ncbi:MAG: hypothetical protein Q8L13_11995 [Bradyrhizobium sp.]|uniref:hypothetical protein n=1 Tax=Bradyrhizobium sp. TaxID=376 RepID=UPI002731FC41|nr:hypothetical protein [Bradyrhizobium sp.]MDP1867048.1 hypothetical protein [Bradyrhizobium sp.]